MYVRLSRTVKDKGILIPPSEVPNLVDDPNIDWYCSPFVYGEDAVQYFESHNQSIKGYTGEAYTSSLYWDLDLEGDFEKVRESAISLVNFLDNKGYGFGIEIFFSGKKGVHIFLHTSNEFTPQEVKKICQNIAHEAKVDPEVLDTSVYNLNRIFRVPYTRHQDTGLFKILLSIEDLHNKTPEEIREAAQAPEGFGSYEAEEVDASELYDLYGQIVEPQVSSTSSDFEAAREKYGENFNPLNCPPNKRRCIYVLENGYFGSGERENATIRLVAYYKGQEKSREDARELILDAYKKRDLLYSDLNPWTEGDIDRNLEQVYSPNWNGGTYSCRTDDYLRSKCDLGSGCCANENVDKVNAITIGGLLAQYEEYGNESLEEYPKTGIVWLDQQIRLRPKNFSIINGANGSGKTSLIINMMESLNEQKMYHIFFSLDMANTSLLEKLAARHTDYSQREIEAAFNRFTRNPEIIEEVKKVLADKYKYTIFDFTSTVTSEYIENSIIALKTREREPINIQVAFIDYAGRLAGDKDSEYANATQIALQANDLCKKAKIHAVYLSQIPREDGDHTSPIYSSRVSKNSGAWEENATIVINCWRPFGDGRTDNDYYMHLYIAKNRSGALGERAYGWDGKTGTIYELNKKEFMEYYNLCQDQGKPEPLDQYPIDDDIERAKKKGIMSQKSVKGVQFNYEEPPKVQRASDSEFQRAVVEVMNTHSDTFKRLAESEEADKAEAKAKKARKILKESRKAHGFNYDEDFDGQTDVEDYINKQEANDAKADLEEKDNGKKEGRASISPNRGFGSGGSGFNLSKKK